MKKVMLTASMFFLAIMMFAGSWNPYVSQGIISPAPLQPAELNGTGLVSFNIGNTGTDPFIYEQGQELKVVITFSKGRPDHVNPVAALEGSWVKYFNWTYEPVGNTLTGIQNQAIPMGPTQGNISVRYQVTENSTRGPVLNGFKAEIITPTYMSTSNAKDDDMVSSYTLTVYNPLYGIDEKEDQDGLQIYSNENNIYVKDLLGKELQGKMKVYSMIGQLITTKKLKGGALNKFQMTVEQGYYLVEVFDKDRTYKAEVYLTR